MSKKVEIKFLWERNFKILQDFRNTEWQSDKACRLEGPSDERHITCIAGCLYIRGLYSDVVHPCTGDWHSKRILNDSSDQQWSVSDGRSISDEATPVGRSITNIKSK